MQNTWVRTQVEKTWSFGRVIRSENPSLCPPPPKPTKGKLEDRPVEPDIQEASPYDANTIQVQSSHSEADRDGASFLHLTLGSGRRMNYVRRASVF